MSPGPFDLNEARAAYFSRWQAIEAAKARELASMTDERAWQIILSLAAAELWRIAFEEQPIPPDPKRARRSAQNGPCCW